ncbi:diadenylate cyclase CdaA [Kordia algicida OT-1]|uniref:Diadenylate cyclase n=1 Tax=Kordia algicida OT-1 TaxID=391587 RepID=A9EB68_9FLAO|nr:diadenylate cyclase CdaA [Kordia algicida]EDP94590.1 putative transmembrane protein [Kordia algicida OT-1]
MDFIGFLNFGLLDFIEIILVAVLLYYIYKLVRGTAAINIFIGIVIIFIIWKVTEALDMKVLSNIFGGFINVGIIALFIVFQQEIRKFLLMIGSTNFATKRSFIKHFKFLKQEANTETDVQAIVSACEKMSATKTGAIIVIERNNSLDFVKNSGDTMGMDINVPTLESIFFKNSPLHDGAIIVEGNRVTATRVILPVSKEPTIPQRFGLRHRAAVGITEKTDALVLVVSEETGQISYIRDGEFILYEDLAMLQEMLQNDLS